LILVKQALEQSEGTINNWQTR